MVDLDLAWATDPVAKWCLSFLSLSLRERAKQRKKRPSVLGNRSRRCSRPLLPARLYLLHP
jgi:hypothetical protein